MTKTVIFGKEAKDRLLKGVNIVADAVTTTMGVGGRNVVFEDDYMNLRSTKDGVTVAKMITNLLDPVEDFGAKLIKNAAIKTADVAGDGTTTATLLTQYIANTSVKAVQEGANAVELKRGVEQGLEYVLKELKSYSKPISSVEDLTKVATLSANGDNELGKYIAEAINKVGRDGIVSIEETRYGETRLEIVEGIQWKKGMISPYFATDDKNSKCILENGMDDVKVLLYDKTIGRKEEVIPFLNYSLETSSPILIVAEDIVGEALATLLMNKHKLGIKICAVKASQYGDKRKEFLQDLAIITGGKVVSFDLGEKLSDFEGQEKEVFEGFFGNCRRVEVKSEATTIIDSKGSEEKILERASEIKHKIENAESPFQREYLQDRLGTLVGAVAVVNVYGITDVELKERKDRAEDALFATYCALDEGVVTGGGVPLLGIANVGNLEFSKMNFVNEHQKKGFEILLNACKQPFSKIMSNAGIENEEFWKISNALMLDEEGTVYDPLKKEFVNAFENGIIDPFKVTKTALNNAVSVAGTILLTESVIYTEREENKQEQFPQM